MDIKDPRVVGVIGDLKEQKEAVRAKRPLLVYAPKVRPVRRTARPRPGDQQ